MINWKRQRINTDVEKKIAIGMIVSTKFIKESFSILSIDLLKLSYVKIIVDWCQEYYHQYSKSPGNTIKDIFESQIRKNALDDTQAELISKFLENLSDQYNQEDTFNVDYILDEVEVYLKKRKLENLAADITAYLGTSENVAEVESLVSNFKRVSRPKSEGIDILTNIKAIQEAFSKEENTMFQLKGDLGKIMGPFTRGDFLAVVGPAKRGKTWWLQEIGLQGLYKGFKVLFVSLEMTQPQIIARIYRSITGKGRKKAVISIPVFDCKRNQNNSCKHIDIKKVNLHKPVACDACRKLFPKDFEQTFWKCDIERDELDWQTSVKKSRALKLLVRSGKFKLLCFPAKSINVLDLINYLDNMEHYDNFIPDVIIVDYADIMGPIGKIKEGQGRHSINETWEYLRGIAQQRHCLMVTASHSHKDTFKRRIKQGDWAEEGRKFNHISMAMALNQTTDQQKIDCMEIGILGARHQKADSNVSVTVLNQWDIGKTCLDSYCRDLYK